MASRIIALMGAILAIFSMGSVASAQAPNAPIRTPEGFGQGAGTNFSTFTKRWFNCNESGTSSLRAQLQYVKNYRDNERDQGVTTPHPFVLYAWFPECDITLLSELPPVDDRTVLAGKGATLRNYGFSVRGKDSTIMDWRIVNPGTAGSPRDGISVHFGAKNINIQHVTVIGASDGSIDVTEGAQDVTVQHSILARPLTTFNPDGSILRGSTNGILFDGGTSCPPLVETKRVTYLHNLFVNGTARNPLIQYANCPGIAASATTAEVLGNVIANWSSFPTPNIAGQGTFVLDGAAANLVNNYLSNPNVPPGNVQRGRNGLRVCHAASVPACAGVDSFGRAYVSGNLLGTEPAWNFTATESTEAVPFPTSGINYGALPSACAAATTVLSTSGAVTGGRTAEESAEIATVQLAGC